MTKDLADALTSVDLDDSELDDDELVFEDLEARPSPGGACASSSSCKCSSTSCVAWLE